jgi:hypothetical protein
VCPRWSTGGSGSIGPRGWPGICANATDDNKTKAIINRVIFFSLKFI